MAKLARRQNLPFAHASLLDSALAKSGAMELISGHRWCFRCIFVGSHAQSADELLSDGPPAPPVPLALLPVSWLAAAPVPPVSCLCQKSRLCHLWLVHSAFSELFSSSLNLKVLLWPLLVQSLHVSVVTLAVLLKHRR